MIPRYPFEPTPIIEHRAARCPSSRSPRDQGSDSRTPCASDPDFFTPADTAWLAALNRRCEQASALIVLFAMLWFATASIGASLP